MSFKIVANVLLERRRTPLGEDGDLGEDARLLVVREVSSALHPRRYQAAGFIIVSPLSVSTEETELQAVS